MATSKITQDDAREWLASLQQVGEGWYRQVALAIKAGAPKALGINRREFTTQIGQRLLDPREAIVELYQQGHSQQAIADILHVAPGQTVARVLYEEGLTKELPPWVAAEIAPGRGDSTGEIAPGRGDLVDSTAEDLDEEVAALQDEVAALRQDRTEAIKTERARAKTEQEKLRAEVQALRSRLRDLGKQLEATGRNGKSSQDQLRAEKEREAAVAAVEARFAPMLAKSIVGMLKVVRGDLKEATRIGGVTPKSYDDIVTAYDAVGDELNVLAASIGEEVSA